MIYFQSIRRNVFTAVLTKIGIVQRLGNEHNLFRWMIWRCMYQWVYRNSMHVAWYCYQGFNLLLVYRRVFREFNKRHPCWQFVIFPNSCSLICLLVLNLRPIDSIFRLYIRSSGDWLILEATQVWVAQTMLSGHCLIKCYECFPYIYWVL